MNAARRLAASLRALLRPGYLTREYLDGRGDAFVSPATLYLCCTIAWFVLNPLVHTVARRIQPLPPAAPGSCTAIHLKETPFGTIIAASGPGDSLLLADIDTTSLSGRIASHIGRVACDPEAFEEAVLPTLPVLLFLCMPVFAVLMHAAFRTREPAFAASLVFTLHLHAMLFIVLIVSDLLSAWPSAVVDTLVTIGGVVFTSWYYYEGALRAYGAGRAETMWKTTVVGLGYGVVYTAGVVAVLMWLLLRA